MRVLQVFNQQRAEEGGEEKVVRNLVELLNSHGVEVELHMASSRGLETSKLLKIKAAASGFYSFSSYELITEKIRRFRPDVVNVHNIYPLISPSVFVACRDTGVPSVFRVASQIITCPTWYHVHNGSICERCVGGKEYWCVIQNCRDNLVESAVYAARSAFVRKRNMYSHVTLFIAPSQFMKDRLAGTGIAPDRIAHVANMVRTPTPRAEPLPSPNPYVGFAGRLSSEKGVTVLLEAARRLPSIPFRIAGDGPQRRSLEEAAPSNVRFEGLLKDESLSAFYAGARIVVVPSVTYDTAPNVALEALSHGVPVIASQIGGTPEVVLDGRTGRLVDPGEPELLANAINDLWSRPEVASEMGKAGFRLVSERHNPSRFVTETIRAYERAIDLHRTLD